MKLEPASESATADRIVADLIAGVSAVARGRASTDALEASLLAGLVEESGSLEAAGAEAGMRIRSVAAELGSALRVSDRTMERRLNEAFVLVHDFPDVHQSLASGEISKAHAAVIVDAGVPLTAEARVAFVPRALDLARAESPNRLRSMLAVVAEQVQERTITERHREARLSRGVWITDEADGMSTLHAHLPSVLVHGAVDRISEMARTLRKSDPSELHGTLPLQAPGERPIDAAVSGVLADDRTLDQTRADVLADLLLASTPGSLPSDIGVLQAHVSVILPADSLTPGVDSGAVLAGVGPIDADDARRLAGSAAGWDRVIADPASGTVLATDRYRPTAAIRRMLRALDLHCRFPGCRQPTTRCDADHGLAWAHGGTTDTDNLAHLCKRHHTLKHAKNWTVKSLGGGELEWTSPLGSIYVDAPPSRVMFQVACSPPVERVVDCADAPAAGLDSAPTGPPDSALIERPESPPIDPPGSAPF